MIVEYVVPVQSCTFKARIRFVDRGSWIEMVPIGGGFRAVKSRAKAGKRKP